MPLIQEIKVQGQFLVLLYVDSTFHQHFLGKTYLYVLLTAALHALKGPFMKSTWKSLYYCNIEVKGGRGSNLIILSHKKRITLNVALHFRG